MDESPRGTETDTSWRDGRKPGPLIFSVSDDELTSGGMEVKREVRSLPHFPNSYCLPACPGNTAVVITSLEREGSDRGLSELEPCHGRSERLLTGQVMCRPLLAATAAGACFYLRLSEWKTPCLNLSSSSVFPCFPWGIWNNGKEQRQRGYNCGRSTGKALKGNYLSGHIGTLFP